jgi:osmoprotectant transport system permease protein
VRRALAAALAIVFVCAGARGAGERPIRVGSKKFTESVILGEVATLLVRAAGVPAEHLAQLGGTRLLWDALRAGEIDAYVEYTGTLEAEIFAGRAEGGPALAAALAAAGVRASAPLGFEDGYALAMRERDAAREGVRAISDLERLPPLRLGLTNEFLERRDGFPALAARYALSQHAVRPLDHDVAYRAIAEGATDVIDVYTTDAEIERLSLRVLADDRRALPTYAAVLVSRADLARRAPAAAAALERMAGAFSVADVRRLVGRARLAREPEAAVAADFARARFGVGAPAAPPGLAGRIGRRTLEHLLLVGISLGLAIAIGVPLGAAAFLRPRFGRGVLAAIGVAQTLPALALLVFMVPLLGVGARPAIAALVLYGLLPIARDTHAGLAGIAPALRESAAALGLSRGAVLRLVEGPLALRSVLAGVRTAAVWTVGAATLGALVGAGGYGQPILTGVRLDDTALILEGAVPAALLALIAEALFERLERALVSPGLRAR